MDLHGLNTKHEQQEDLIVMITQLRTMPALSHILFTTTTETV